MDGEYGRYKPTEIYEAHGLLQARCGQCRAFINENYAFCPKCGVEIAWDDEDTEEE